MGEDPNIQTVRQSVRQNPYLVCKWDEVVVRVVALLVIVQVVVVILVLELCVGAVGHPVRPARHQRGRQVCRAQNPGGRRGPGRLGGLRDRQGVEVCLEGLLGGAGGGEAGPGGRPSGAGPDWLRGAGRQWRGGPGGLHPLPARAPRTHSVLSVEQLEAARLLPRPGPLRGENNRRGGRGAGRAGAGGRGGGL